MLGDSQVYYYNKTTKKALSCFSYLFSNIKVESPDGISIVPVNFVSKNTFYSSKNIRSAVPAVQLNLPAISFDLVGMKYNSDIQTIKNNTWMANRNYQDGFRDNILSPVPYQLDVVLTIGATELDTGLQILEQIIPAFAPCYTIQSKDLPDFNLNNDIVVTLTSITSNFPSDIVMASAPSPILTWDLSFTLDVRYYPVINNDPIILNQIINTYLKSPPNLWELKFNDNIILNSKTKEKLIIPKTSLIKVNGRKINKNVKLIYNNIIKTSLKNSKHLKSFKNSSIRINDNMNIFLKSIIENIVNLSDRKKLETFLNIQNAVFVIPEKSLKVEYSFKNNIEFNEYITKEILIEFQSLFDINVTFDFS